MFLLWWFVLCSSKVGISGLPCTETNRGWMDTGQGKVYSARGVRTALCDMQGGVSASVTGIPPALFKRAPFKCAVLSVLRISVYTHVHAYTHRKPLSPTSPWQSLYALICVDNCTNLPILPWNSTVTWWCSNCCVTVRGSFSLTPFWSPFQDANLLKNVGPGWYPNKASCHRCRCKY